MEEGRAGSCKRESGLHLGGPVAVQHCRGGLIDGVDHRGVGATEPQVHLILCPIEVLEDVRAVVQPEAKRRLQDRQAATDHCSSPSPSPYPPSSPGPGI